MTEHILKLNDKYFDAVKNGVKTFEVRKNDRDYKVGDTLILRRCNDEGVCVMNNNNSLGKCGTVYDEVITHISYILSYEEFPVALKEGYVVLALSPIMGKTIWGIWD